jgi:hypothetical protein
MENQTFPQWYKQGNKTCVQLTHENERVQVSVFDLIPSCTITIYVTKNEAHHWLQRMFNNPFETEKWDVCTEAEFDAHYQKAIAMQKEAKK